VVAWVIGPSDISSTEVLRCWWRPKPVPGGFCEAFHIEENILLLDKSQFLGALSTKKWTDVSSNWETTS